MRIEKYIIAIAVIWFVFVIMVYGDFVSTDDIEEKKQVLMNANSHVDNESIDNKNMDNKNGSNNTENVQIRTQNRKEESDKKDNDKKDNDKKDSNGKANDQSSENRSENEDSDYNYEGYPNKKYSWWFKRNKDHKQPEAQKEVNLELYDAFYVDNLVKDTDKKKVIYLTFDCGYENGYTPKMLDILKKHDAIATFFVTKPFIKDEPQLVKRMKKEGHIVGNHTVHHPSMPEKSVRENKIELIECAEYMKEATGYEMDKVMRPPMGEYSERSMRVTKDMGYKTIFWSMAYLDYDVNRQPGADYVVQYYKDNHHNGAIPLIHNVSSSNAEALDDVLTFLEGEGYEFGSTLELGEPKNKKK